MSLKAFAAKIFATIVVSKISKWARNPLKTQEKVFKDLISSAMETHFGRDLITFAFAFRCHDRISQ
ncbi:MAG: hypothetical protein R3274_07610, partial [Desulfobacterales bacterium]|nr:hypothetical protein [Desulfobacterales bacterium]